MGRPHPKTKGITMNKEALKLIAKEIWESSIEYSTNSCERFQFRKRYLAKIEDQQTRVAVKTYMENYGKAVSRKNGAKNMWQVSYKERKNAGI